MLYLLEYQPAEFDLGFSSSSFLMLLPASLLLLLLMDILLSVAVTISEVIRNKFGLRRTPPGVAGVFGEVGLVVVVVGDLGFLGGRARFGTLLLIF